MYVCVCIHAYIHIYMQSGDRGHAAVNIHTYIHTYIHTHMQGCDRGHAAVNIHTYIHTCRVVTEGMQLTKDDLRLFVEYYNLKRRVADYA